MLAFRYEFCAETVFFCIICKGVEIEIKPVKRLSDNILVLHLVVKLAIIFISKVDHDASILFFEKISQVA